MGDTQDLSLEKSEKEKYSFSKLSSFYTCPYGWWLRYEEHKVGIGNAFSSYGTFVHSIMERYAKGEADIWELPALYEWEFETAVPEKFPWNKYTVLHDSYYRQGLDFLKSFQGYDNYKILGVEQSFDQDIDDWVFTGIIDLILEDKEGKIIIRDYKSKATFKNDKEKREYARQLYLYSMYVKNKLGKFPDELQFLMFRKQTLVTIPFNEEDYSEAIGWAKNTVQTIRDALEFPPKCDDFYGNNLCNHREYCDFKKKE